MFIKTLSDELITMHNLKFITSQNQSIIKQFSNSDNLLTLNYIVTMNEKHFQRKLKLFYESVILL